MREVLEKEIKYAVNQKAKDNLKDVLEYLKKLESIIYKYKEMLVMNDEELEIYKSIGVKK